MTFQALAARFEKEESGSDSFKGFFKEAFDLMKTDAAHAALYFVPAVAAQSYVRNYEDQAIEPAFADHAKATIVGYNRQIVAALAGDAAAKLACASAISLAYEWDERDF